MAATDSQRPNKNVIIPEGQAIMLDLSADLYSEEASASHETPIAYSTLCNAIMK